VLPAVVILATIGVVVCVYAATRGLQVFSDTDNLAVQGASVLLVLVAVTGVVVIGLMLRDSVAAATSVQDAIQQMRGFRG